MAPTQPKPRRSTRSTKGKEPERLVNDPPTTFKVAKTKQKKKQKIPEPPRPPINRRARGLKEVWGLERMVARLDNPLQTPQGRRTRRRREVEDLDEDGVWDDDLEEMGGWDEDVVVERKEQVKKEGIDNEDEKEFEVMEVVSKKGKKGRRVKINDE
ncbi:hypothetical protein H2199_002017 [Coniosporium tulheliwenetii]|uniref:Uncharacterized protein n=1 Tax=Coniosporium tulheliwenetii TaxID=3383036 RepID=A0ACC2ZHM9_9PEZI|nr:hypothetical protein H2199_002017 [Cladosporium sp. JES 115]